MASTKYLLISLPTSIANTHDKEGTLSTLQKTITSNCGTVNPFNFPEFKIGTLDALVQQADDLGKLEASCEAVVAKVGDSLKTLLVGDEDRLQQQKVVNDSKMRLWS
jgi:V-type H+-transporting ATPase subunit C